MTSSEKMALWSTFNALLREHGKPDLRYGAVQAWWDRYESELQLEKAYIACQKRGAVWE